MESSEKERKRSEEVRVREVERGGSKAGTKVREEIGRSGERQKGRRKKNKKSTKKWAREIEDESQRGEGGEDEEGKRQDQGQ